MERPGRRPAELDGAKAQLYERDHVVVDPHVKDRVDLAPIVNLAPVGILVVDVPAAPVRQAASIAARQQVMRPHDGWLTKNRS